uniref:Transposase n=1 Tax=Ascaris lumbricoides TaxID=6252 RepID=A0A0M3HVY5_ASCLU
MTLRERHRTEHQQPCRVTDRAPLENGIVIVAEEGLPRAE